jgi:hypothetical protein
MADLDSWWMIAGFVVPAVLVVLATVAIKYRLDRLDASLSSRILNARPKEKEKEKDKEKDRRNELADLRADLRKELEALRSQIRSVHADTQKLLAQPRPQQQQTQAPREPSPRFAAPHYTSYDEDEPEAPAAPPPVDGVAQLLSVANRIVQQSSMSLDAFRSNTSTLAARISPWPAADDRPVAFLVEYRGSLYAVPNVIKPARLPQEWFNGDEFGVNDEIRSVVALPRLARRGDGFDVQEQGVFSR